MREKMWSESHESYLQWLIFLQEAKGLQTPRKLTFVNYGGWSNWRLWYQPGKVCQASKVHKIRETNFVDLR
jgi:hypothetical protein